MAKMCRYNDLNETDARRMTLKVTIVNVLETANNQQNKNYNLVSQYIRHIL